MKPTDEEIETYAANILRKELYLVNGKTHSMMVDIAKWVHDQQPKLKSFKFFQKQLGENYYAFITPVGRYDLMISWKGFMVMLPENSDKGRHGWIGFKTMEEATEAIDKHFKEKINELYE